MVYSDDVSNWNVKGKNTEALQVASNKTGPGINTGKYKCTIFSRSACRTNHNIKVGNTFFETLSQFKYLQISLAYPNCFHEKIKSWDIC